MLKMISKYSLKLTILNNDGVEFNVFIIIRCWPNAHFISFIPAVFRLNPFRLWHGFTMRVSLSADTLYFIDARKIKQTQKRLTYTH